MAGGTGADRRLHPGRGVPAQILNKRATSVEDTSARRINRGREFTLENNSLNFFARIRHWSGGEQRLGVGMLRLGKQVFTKAMFDWSAKIHHHYFISDVLYHR